MPQETLIILAIQDDDNETGKSAATVWDSPDDQPTLAIGATRQVVLVEASEK